MGCAAEGRHEPRDLDEFDAAGLTVASTTYEIVGVPTLKLEDRAGRGS
jgi:hypothetical protein